ncbi:MAG TPA: MFS transporter [Gammaproteobacteria bacterium]|nr:MFS transporter [Gammaproteobacteria bacterium]
MNTMNLNAVRVPKYLPWLVVLSAAMFFFYEFIQMQMFNAISQSLLSEFHVGATTLGYVASCFFLGNVLLLFPAGMLLDRFSTRKIILAAMWITVISTVLFSQSHSIFAISIYHLAAGFGNAFCFLSSIRIASRWFPAERMALVLGVVIALAMFGGMVAQTPLTWLISEMGWRNSLLVVSGLGVLLIILIWAVVRDYPPGQEEFYKNQRQQLRELGVMKSVFLALTNLQNWFSGLFISFLNVPLMLLGGLWGSLYLTTVDQVTSLQSSYVISAMFLGAMAGFPAIGWFSDKIKRRRLPMIIFSVLSIPVMVAIMMLQNLSLWSLVPLFFALGFLSGAQTVGYPAISESNDKSIIGTAMGLSAVLIMGAPMIFEPLFGKLMDKNWDGTVVNGAHVYNAAAYHSSMSMLVIILVAGLVASLCVRETFAREK